MFWAYLGSSSGGTTVCIQQLVFIILLDDCLLSWLDWKTESSKTIIGTNCCIHMVVPPDDGPRYARNL